METRSLLLTAARCRRSRSWPPDGGALLARLPADLIDPAVEALLLECVDVAWQGGWQPAELLRRGRLECGTSAASRLVAVAIATDHARRPPATLHPDWVSHVLALALPPAGDRADWLHHWMSTERLGRDAGLAAVVEAAASLIDLPRLDPLLPPPGRPHVVANRRVSSDPVLERIRNLLAKAESTNFEAEASAFTAKAQELMTRHAIDLAALEVGARSSDEPLSIRVPLDPPYVRAKSLLLHVVAEANQCRAVFDPAVSMSTVVGIDSSVAAVELLFTSLLVQSSIALDESARTAGIGSRARSRGFRSSFLDAFAWRIHERLTAINEAVLAQAQRDHGDGFLPVLRARTDAIDRFIEERFGRLRNVSTSRTFDAAGWASGRAAADSARLAAGEIKAS
jgi:hypothetical protein